MTASEPAKRRVSIDLSQEMLEWLDGLKAQLGHRSRGAILEHLLAALREQDVEDDEPDPGFNVSQQTSTLAEHEGPRVLDDNVAIVLIRSEQDAVLDSECIQDETCESPIGERSGAMVPRPSVTSQRSGSRASAGTGIQLPGFVRRQARELRRSLEAPPQAAPGGGLSLISAADLSDALSRSDQHWLEVYGQPPHEAVLEASMLWLSRDVWPQSDHSDGRPFSWNLTQQVVSSFAPTWMEGEASLARVITAAGVLEDPFSGATLALRVPTLITRFVQRHRSRQKRTTSFEAIDQSMTVHGALRLLELPTVADRPYSLQEIREAYREQAQSHHPDAGGSADAMRRLNEAYQFLKERYRRAA